MLKSRLIDRLLYYISNQQAVKDYEKKSNGNFMKLVAILCGPRTRRLTLRRALGQTTKNKSSSRQALQPQASSASTTSASSSDNFNDMCKVGRHDPDAVVATILTDIVKDFGDMIATKFEMKLDTAGAVGNLDKTVEVIRLLLGKQEGETLGSARVAAAGQRDADFDRGAIMAARSAADRDPIVGGAAAPYAMLPGSLAVSEVRTAPQLGPTGLVGGGRDGSLNLFRGYLDGQDWFGRTERDQKREVATAGIVGQGERAGGVCSAHPSSTAAPGLHPRTSPVMSASALTPTTPDSTRSCINSAPAHHFAPGVVPTSRQEASSGLCWPNGSKGDIEREIWDEGRVRYWWFLAAMIEWNHCRALCEFVGVWGSSL